VVVPALAAALVVWACARSAPAPVAAGPVSPPAAVAAAAAPGGPPRTPEECRACRGDWGVHGLAPTPSCNCRTTDAGKRCTDGADCQGMCLAAAGAAGREIVEAGPPARGFFVGKCSEMVTVFGCNQLIERGARARGPVSLDEPQQMLCVD
jgi:hypothetical protein